MKLPEFDHLTPDQDDVLTLHLDKSAIVTGPPGTGKTIMALQRAHLLHRAGHPTLLLMYNRLLASYTRRLVTSLDLGAVTSTFHNWFGRFWQRNYGGRPPGDGRYRHDWHRCLSIIGERPPPAEEIRHVIVDEGQDLPREFFFILGALSHSIMVFADENQRITESQSTVAEIRAATGISTLLRLSHNRRNARPIAEFANHFYIGTSSGTAELPPARPGDEPPVLVSHPRTYEAVKYLVDHERASPDHAIGVLLPRVDDVRRYYNRLHGKTCNPVQLYVNKTKRRPGDPPVDMATPGIKVLTWSSCKGLEFDSVFLAELQSMPGDPTSDDTRMKMYVASTRAKSALTLLYTGDGEPAIIGAVPLDLVTDERT